MAIVGCRTYFGIVLDESISNDAMNCSASFRASNISSLVLSTGLQQGEELHIKDALASMDSESSLTLWICSIIREYCPASVL